MSNFSTILHKRNSTAGAVPNPSSLSAGEIAINTADAKLFVKTAGNTIETFLNASQQPYVFNSSLSSVSSQYGDNTVTGILAAALGGVSNNVSGAGSTIVNGSDNSIDGDYAFIGNGSNNTITIDGDFGGILGGQNNTLNHQDSFILGSDIVSHASNFTYVNNLSSTGKIYGDGSELVGIVAGDTELRAVSANWESTFTTVQTNSSSNWDNSSVVSYIDNNFLPVSGGTLTGNLSVLGDLVYVDTSVAVVSTMYIDTNTILDPALRITQRGSGDVIRVEDSDNPDSTPFIINSDGLVGIGISVPNEELTVIGNVSATGSYYGDGSNLTGIIAGDTEATTFVRSNSANWDSVYTSYNANSASIDASYITSGTLDASRLPTFNGDITTDTSAGSVSATVVSIQGNPVSVQNPANGQILQWNGAAWVPGSIATGGSGGGGIFYYFNYANNTGISPTDGLPTSPVAPSLLGREYSVGSGSLQSGELTRDVYTLVAGFVSLSSEPAVTNIPAGLWDFNIWVDIVGNATVNQTSMQVRVYKYTSSTSTYTPLASSENLYIYDPTVIAQYIVNVTMPQTTLLSSDRIYIEFWAAKSVNQSRKIRFWFDSTHPSHVHTTLPSVAGSGLVKTVNGVYQSPASLLVNSDVASNAAIEQTKISGLTDVASKASVVYTTVQANSSTNWNNEVVKQYTHSNFLPLSGGTITGSLSVLGNVTYLDTAVGVTSAMYIDAATTEPALRITQSGTGDVIRVEDTNNPDSTPFIINSDGVVGVGTSSPNEKLTVVGNISATGFYYGNGSNLTGIVHDDTAVSTLVRTNSANWEAAYSSAGADLLVRSLTGNWESTYTTVCASSAKWESTYTTVTQTSGDWDSSYTTVQTNSANWQTAYAYVSANSVNLTATNIFVTNDLTVTDTVSAKYYQGTLIDWMTLVRGTKTTPTLLATIGTGDVYTYVYSTATTDKTYYRYIATDGSEDSFYGNFTNPTLSNLIATKKIIL